MNGKFAESDDLSKRKILWHKIDPKPTIKDDGQPLNPYPMIVMGSKHGHRMYGLEQNKTILLDLAES